MFKSLLSILIFSLLLPAVFGQDKKEAKGKDEVIKIGYSAWPGWLPWKVAEEKGLFKKKWRQC